MRLCITTPTSIVTDQNNVVSLRAEDESGSFGILEGHADFLTALTISVVSWKHADGRHGYCAVRYGVLAVKQGREIVIATREAVLGDEPEKLESVVLAGFRAAAEEEVAARVASMQLHMKAIRQIIRYLKPDSAFSSGEVP